jgi:hypothetical protein
MAPYDGGASQGAAARLRSGGEDIARRFAGIEANGQSGESGAQVKGAPRESVRRAARIRKNRLFEGRPRGPPFVARLESAA